MFERRLKVFFGILIAVTVLLLLRAAHVQIVSAGYWREEAERSITRSQLLATTRGSIRDVHGRELAGDHACIDAAVDFRAIEDNPAWIRTKALNRLLSRAGAEYRRANEKGREAMLNDEINRVKAEIELMWHTLAEVSGQTREQIEQVRIAIRNRIAMLKRSIWYTRYMSAIRKLENRGPEPWYREWIITGEGAPQLDSFDVEIPEQKQAHVILPNVSNDVHIRLKKHSERFPGLVLQRGKHRVYPYGAAAAHVIGHLGRVTDVDLKGDPNSEDELRRYLPYDLIGCAGVEALAEQVLRGARGRYERLAGRDEIRQAVRPVPGRDVRITIDIELQAEIEQAFQHVEWRDHLGNVSGGHEMHGAAVVIDLPTGEVRALVSYPTYDLNRLTELYPSLSRDRVNLPLFNRATRMSLEPGSTVKPIVGIGAVAQGIITPDKGIECTGYLIIDGQRLRSYARCWTASFAARYGEHGVAHHPFPPGHAHPDGFLTFSDALQRSCNVYFETLGHAMGIDGLAYWYDRFGLGRPTGIGLRESPGLTPKNRGPRLASIAWFSSIGQTQIRATPIQIANAIATIARGGVWVRPRLIASPRDFGGPPASGPGEPDVVDLKLPPEAIQLALDGMYRAVNTRAGTGWELRRSDITIAGKTGTATAAPFRIRRLDADGRPVVENGKPVYEDDPAISTPESPNPEMPWYRGRQGPKGLELSHAWFVGFAPARDPKIAFAVMLEYGGSGGHDTAPIVKAVLDACIHHRYLEPQP